MQLTGAVAPDAERLRAWQRFVTENVEFRLGVAVGAAVAPAWGQTAGDLDPPTPETWRPTSRLPCIAFWFRELLPWGTPAPFLASALPHSLPRPPPPTAHPRPA